MNRSKKRLIKQLEKQRNTFLSHCRYLGKLNDCKEPKLGPLLIEAAVNKIIQQLKDESEYIVQLKEEWKEFAKLLELVCNDKFEGKLPYEVIILMSESFIKAKIQRINEAT